jgi:hypothetical protein
LPNSSVFTIPAMLMLLVAIYYRPKSEDL